MAFCDGGYTTNLPIADVTGGQAWVGFGYDGGPLAAEHGGPGSGTDSSCLWPAAVTIRLPGSAISLICTACSTWCAGWG